jgi:hypothetical protein
VSRFMKSVTVFAVTLTGIAVWAQPALANTVTREILHVDATFVDSDTCAFDIDVHVSGTFTITDYFDNSGFLFKSIFTEGPGEPFTFTETAKGTTLTMQMQSFSEVLTYNPDGSVKSDTIRGILFKFTVPGGGIVFLDAGTARFDSEGNLVFEGGPHQALHGDVAGFCAAFG